jgi:SAM-dependent methyltransferase
MTEAPAPITIDEGRVRFGDDPGNYEAARPPYPSRVYEILTERCGLAPGIHAFEVGPATGLATRELATRGANVIAIEPDPRLAAYLASRSERERAPVTVRNSTFESARVRAGGFDLGAAATSFHWVDQPRGLSKVHRLLRPGGWWAMWWNIFGDPLGYDAFHEATTGIMRRTGNIGGDPVFALESETRTSQLLAAGFDSIDCEIIRWVHRFTPETTRALYATFSNVTRLPPPDQEEILDQIERVARHQFDGIVDRTLLTVIYTARKPE